MSIDNEQILAALELHRQGALGPAKELYIEILRREPKQAEVYVNLGLIFREEGEVSEAVRCYRRAIRLEPDLAAAHYYLARALLSVGEFERGWEEYEWRGLAQPALLRPCGQPCWDGSPLDGRSLLVSSERTVSTQIMFASVLSDLAARVGGFVLECEPMLVPLLARSLPQIDVVGTDRSRDASGALRLPGIDVHVYLGSVVGMFRKKIDEFPRHHGYLAAECSVQAKWRGRLQSLGPGVKVGIAWRAGASAEQQHKRTVPLSLWQPVLDVPNIHVINLQPGQTGDELQARRKQVGARIQTFDIPDPQTDLDTLAAMVSAMDLVITADGLVAHLAGALGVPAWTLLHTGADWRFMRHREDSPWFPSMRLFRQSKAGEWTGVLGRVAEQLGQLAAERSEEVRISRAA